MIFKNVIGFIIVLSVYSCVQLITDNKRHNKNIDAQTVVFKSGLSIESGFNRGTEFTDTFGNNQNVRYIPITITNHNSTPIHIQLDFSKEYEYPIDGVIHKFKVLLLPKVYSLDGVKLTTNNEVLMDSFQIELRNYLEDGSNPAYQLSANLEPNENILVAIGTLYPIPTNCGIVPNELFVESNSDNFQFCDSLFNPRYVDNSQFNLRLKLNYCEGRCMQIHCGQLTYPKE